MTNSIQFPDTPYKGQQHTHNGVVYYWDTVSNSWVLLSSMSVNKNYVDSRDQLRYRRDGNDYIYGDVRIKIENNDVAQETIRLKTDGTIITSGESRLHFSQVGSVDDYGKISYGLDNDPVDIVAFNATGIYNYKTTTVDAEDVSGRLYIIDNPGLEEVVLFDVKQVGPSSAVNKATILLPDNENSYFNVKTDTSEDQVSINSEGKLKVTCSLKESFIVTNQMSESDPPFRVDANTHKVFTSAEYNEGLLGRGNSGPVTGPNGPGLIQDFIEPNLVATKGYVDAMTGTEKGRAICAGTEDEAEIGGFWYDGRGLFLKVGWQVKNFLRSIMHPVYSRLI